MKGDFTRNTFNRARHYSRVLMQQGRVQLDADWNEQHAILLNYLRTLTRDIVGPHAGPTDDCGFEIITDETSPRLDVIVADEDYRNQLRAAIGNGDFVIGPGRYYVDGILVENERAILYSKQPGHPSGGLPSLEDLKKAKGVLIYLDVWERHVTCIEDDHIREVALEGPDTCTRAQVVWQVKVLTESNKPAGVRGITGCDAVDGLLHLGTGKLRARARLDQPPADLCATPPSSRYRGAENQLYRVEVHQGRSAVTPATFKWSRDNGSVAFAIRQLDQNYKATLESLGRDTHLSLEHGDWVEVTDDSRVLSGQPGWLAQVHEVFRDELAVTLTVPASETGFPAYGTDKAWLHPLLRRWDHPGDPALGGALAIVEAGDPATGWIDLEDGVQVWFAAGGDYLTGDYWLIPARVATGDVEWPHQLDATGAVVKDTDGNPVAAARRAEGIFHSFAPLLLVTQAGMGPTSVHDCRCRISPLPCVAYEYAYGGGAVGAELISPARRRPAGKRSNP
jgi:Family of unknown function (DUF6519)